MQKEWPHVALLVLSLALGIAIASGLDNWFEGDDDSVSALLASGGTALLIAAAMAGLARFVRWRPKVPAAADVALQRWTHREQIAALLGAMDVGILFLSVDNQVSYYNPAFLRIWQLPATEDLTDAGVQALSVIMGNGLARPHERSTFLLHAPPAGEPDVKLDLPLADGRLVTQQSHAVTDPQGVVLGRMWLFEDVTVQRRNAHQLVRLDGRDALTGQYNRHRFHEELARMVAEARRGGTRLALLLFDLDGFTHINTDYGHRAGDALLIRVANEVAAQVRRNEIFARLGGDDFAILVPEAEDSVLQALAERVTRSVSQAHVEFEGQRLRMTCSCGIALYPDHAGTAQDLVARADAAMNEAKESGKNTWRFYRAVDAIPAMVSPSSPDARVLHALEQGLLELHYQGIYSTRQRTLRHYEVLLRVRDPANANATTLTGEFIAMAEKCGRILEVDRWVLRHAIRELAADSEIPALAVNVSGRSLDDESLPAYIEQELRQAGVAPSRLLVELTETAAVTDLHDARRFIEALQRMGCGVCLDDFGTGFSSFAYLRHLQVDAIKIDGLFIRDLPKDQENQLFVRTIVALARGLHQTTIAECVEDEESLTILRSLGVDYVQGFHLGAPQARVMGDKATQ